MDINKTYGKNVAETIINNLHSRDMEGHYFDNSSDALKFIMNDFEENSSVTWGGSETIKEIGLLDALENSNHPCIKHRIGLSKEEQREENSRIVACDNFLMSTNAITLDGELVNIDGFGNRVSCLIAGPQNVYVIAGINKIVANVEEGISRTRNLVSAKNCLRLGIENPCAKTGKCHDCKGKNTICNQIVVTRGSRIKGRIKVILIGETLGY